MRISACRLCLLVCCSAQNVALASHFIVLRLYAELWLDLAHTLVARELAIETPNLNVTLGERDHLRQNFLDMQILNLVPFVGALK